MNSKRIRFGCFVLAVYAALGVIALTSQHQDDASMPDLAGMASVATGSTSETGGSDASLEWHSFLPGAFK